MTLRPSHSLLLILAAILLMGCGHHRFDAPTGNLLSRTINGVQETFTYDSLDRLTSVSRNGSTTLSTTYSDGGSILYKSDIGNYTYNGLAWRPHAVMEVENTDSLIPPVNQTLTYNADNKLSSIRDGMGRRCDIVYGPDGERWTSTSTVNGALQKTLFYAGNTDGIWTDQTHYTFYLWLPGDVLCVDKVTGTEHDRQFYYMATDHLGSICEVMKADDDLTSVFHADYDAWGRQTVSRDSIGIYRGYTGHEMLPEFGLINMNGRMYDPLLGRFLSPDDYVQLPDLSQSFNRYSYCLNNPLKYTDPSGELFGIDDAILIGISFGAIMGSINARKNGENVLWGTLIGGAIGGLSAWAGGFAAAHFQAVGVWGGILSGGVTGGVTGMATNVLSTGFTNMANGRSFTDGLGSSALSGLLFGCLTGAVSGGIQGYNNAKEVGANPWTRYKEDRRESYATSVKEGVPIQPDPSKHCYAYAGQYADVGHDNHPAEYFLSKAANKGVIPDGANFPTVAREVWSDTNVNVVSGGISLDNLAKGIGKNLQNGNIEVVLAVNKMGTNHIVNLVSFDVCIRYNFFGGGVRNVMTNIRAWDPLNGRVIPISRSSIKQLTQIFF